MHSRPLGAEASPNDRDGKPYRMNIGTTKLGELGVGIALYFKCKPRSRHIRPQNIPRRTHTRAVRCGTRGVRPPFLPFSPAHAALRFFGSIFILTGVLFGGFATFMNVWAGSAATAPQMCAPRRWESGCFSFL